MMRNLVLLLVAITTMPVSAQQYKLWYSQPASHWLEALPVGNSQLGAMVYGGTDVETLALNEETFWSGQPHDNNSTVALEHLQEVRDSIFAGKEEAAHAILDKYFLRGPHGMRFLPLGNVKLMLGHQAVSNYRRELSLGDALATTSYIYKGVRYERTVFASQADHALIVQLKADKRGALSFDVGFDSPLESKVFPVTARGGKGRSAWAVSQLSATVKNVEQEGIKGGLTADCRVEVVADGEVTHGSESLSVKDATVATLYIVAATNYVNYHDVSAVPTKRNNEKLAQLRGKSYKQLLKAHKQRYQEQYNRVSLQLASDMANADIPTDQRLAAFDGSDLELVATMMQYGRYLLISSSQPGGQAANLQGVWNDKMNAPWDSKYTIN
ncbi:MAG: glycoside hydrolase family 95 protein, partial [Prevotella sp.]|nr:glycoside hydrolase family 95 protein [Prevotella sp.]